MDNEDRRYSRLPADFAVHVLDNQLHVNERACDISEVGLKVTTARPLPPRAVVAMRLDLPHGCEPVELKGRVMWATAHTMGIRFEHPDSRVTDMVYRLRQDYERI